MSLDAVLARIDDQMPQALDRLAELLRIPSVSTDPAYAQHCRAAADWLVADLESIGVSAQRRDTSGHPMVVGHVDGPAGAPHLLFYGHYDVQPVDPLDEWRTDPFDPKIEDAAKGKVIRARGSSDDKGQLMTFVEACRAWRDVTGEMPCRITFFFEGEEESGSPSLVPFMQENAEELRADLALICDTGLFQSETPAIVTMLRGMVTEEVTIRGPEVDLHSGFFGGLAQNPIHVLARMLAGLHDETGRVTLAGFYDDIPELAPELRAQWERLGFDHAAFLGAVGLSEPAGEAGRTPLEMIWSRPTAEVNGIWGGYTGAGFKTVLPAEAHAKVSFRLVEGQRPDAVRDAFRAHVKAALPADCTAEFHAHGGSAAGIMDMSGPAFEQARRALGQEWGREAAYVGCGGSIPIAGHFGEVLGMNAMLIGFGKDDDAIHSPNEKYDVESFHKGARSWARVLDALSAPS
ncbi:M20/M25/M40 family metallo-hydrolase [Roseovarius spongiae]|uniref:M20/M25/M40 family metallo-hydrolase n=1 Tax=Roseovarius spongiae TaxID=2320272 RepID=A0A3A8AVJ5_9RHOB|nr:M20/M25/M40 family metallo-hydrolase [Roseovarius spongiae]RKF15148.1 M20/M25/M40 family metallo-hydrolase [Roseovarius spongiae]